MSQTVFASDPTNSSTTVVGLSASPAQAQPPSDTMKIAALLAAMFIYTLILVMAYLAKDQTTMSNLEVGGLTIVTAICGWLYGGSADSSSKTATLSNIASSSTKAP